MNINLNFKPQFAPDVKACKKRQSIRPRGKRRANRGEILHLFTGLRTKHCERLGDHRCRDTFDIDIDTAASSIVLVGSDWRDALKPHQVETIARMDGFGNVADFFAFFRKQYGEGVHPMILYRW